MLQTSDFSPNSEFWAYSPPLLAHGCGRITLCSYSTSCSNFKIRTNTLFDSVRIRRGPAQAKNSKSSSTSDWPPDCDHLCGNSSESPPVPRPAGTQSLFAKHPAERTRQNHPRRTGNYERSTRFLLSILFIGLHMPRLNRIKIRLYLGRAFMARLF